MRVFRTLVAAGVGLLSGLMFAQKSGKKFREELASSDNPLKVLLEELQNVGKEVGGEVTDFVENSEDLQKVLETGRTQFDSFVKSVSGLGKEASEVASKELEKLSDNAKKAAMDLKKSAGKVVEQVKKDSLKKGGNLKKEVQKEMKIIANKMKK
ncbi:MAG: hypothetical protein OEL89_02060 [Candidatus Peregrinibacteria bacterium]|nr:hypothetical protein [Candidatus Peregrinibacteria bacterium]